MTVVKSELVNWIDDVIERIEDGPVTLGVDDIRIREAQFLLDKMADDLEDQLKNIKVDPEGKAADEGEEATVTIEAKEDPTFDIENLVDRYGQDVQAELTADDDLDYFEIECYQTGSPPEKIDLEKSGNTFTLKDTVEDDDEYEVELKMKAHGIFQETEWDITITGDD